MVQKNPVVGNRVIFFERVLCCWGVNLFTYRLMCCKNNILYIYILCICDIFFDYDVILESLQIRKVIFVSII